MHAAFVVLLILPLVFAQEFTCDLQYRSAVMRNGGVVNGKFDYSWTRGRMKITMPPTATRPLAYTELYQFNSGKGLNGGAAPYLDQWVYRSGSSCACETGHLDSGMPMLTPALLSQYNFYTSGGSNNGCTEHTRKATATDPKVPTLSVGATFPCSFKFEDGRSYTLSNCRNTPFTDSSFTPPRDCKCGKPLDIAIVMDRSSSISKTEFLDQKGFVTDFVRQFEYGPFQANLALVHFKSTAWTTLPLTQGNSKANVEASVNELGCPASCDQQNGKCVPNDPTSCCCCCGTSVSSGVRMGADQLKNGRTIASKLLIVITDGYHNTLWDKNGIGADCTNDAAACTADLKAANDYAFRAIGGSRDKIAIYAVGVGSDRDISVPELVIIADGHAERVLRRSNFAELARNNLELIARACDENVAPCGGCCGTCICQKCFAPDACDAPNPCTNATVIGGCCTYTNVSCDAQSTADPCHSYKCDNDPSSASKGTCIVDKPVTCPTSPDPCIRRQCNVTLRGACESITLPGCGNQSIPECASDIDCNDNDMCTDEICTPEGKCVWTKKNATGFTGDACLEPKCISDKGWVNVSKLSCDDGDICFNKTCDPVLGCVSKAINCSDGNECTEDLCDKNRGGCIHAAKVCNNTEIGNGKGNGNGNDNANDRTNGTACGVAFCEDGVCKVRAVPCAGTNLPNIIAVSAGIGTVALVGIIIAAVILCGGLAGGGVYAAAQGAGGGPMGGLQNNPIYKADNTGGMNPLYKA